MQMKGKESRNVKCMTECVDLSVSDFPIKTE